MNSAAGLTSRQVREALRARGHEGVFRGVLSPAQRGMLDAQPDDGLGVWEPCGYRFPPGNLDRHRAHHAWVWRAGPIDFSQLVERLPGTWVARRRADGPLEARCGKHTHLTAADPGALYLMFVARVTPFKLDTVRAHLADTPTS